MRPYGIGNPTGRVRLRTAEGILKIVERGVSSLIPVGRRHKLNHVVKSGRQVADEGAAGNDIDRDPDGVDAVRRRQNVLQIYRIVHGRTRMHTVMVSDRPRRCLPL